MIAFLLAAALAAPQQMTTELVTTGLQAPTFITSDPNDTSRLYVLEQDTAAIRLIKDGVLLPEPVLILDAFATETGERGLLGMAFHPDYANNRYFYVNFTDLEGDTVVQRFRMLTSNPDKADRRSGYNIFTVDQPFPDHNAGMLAFSPMDNYLYIALGDGGAGWIGDPNNRAQSGNTPLGKLLRIDVDNGDPYGIPSDNPFVGPGNPIDEIWSLGLRNPWRFSFDRQTGDLWLGDVGQLEWEEIDFQPASSPGGENYGWRLKEGLACFNPASNCDQPGLTDPILVYDHVADPFRCAVISGYVYRGTALPHMQGHFFFGDWCSSQIWTLRLNELGVVKDFTERTDELAPPAGLDIIGLSSFGEDADGELYFCEYADGEIYKIVPDPASFVLEADPLQGANFNTVRVSGATPEANLFFFVSVSGPGTTTVSELNVDLGLLNPVLAQTEVADATGNAQIQRFISGRLIGKKVWIQTAQIDRVSNFVTGVFE